MKNKKILEYQLQEIFGKKAQSEKDKIWNIFSLIIYSDENDTDLLDLHRLVGNENFVKIIKLFDGRTVEFPKKEKVESAVILSLLYYYKEIKLMSWEDIKKVVPFDFSTISYGLQIRKLNLWIRQRMHELFKRIEEEKDADG